MKISDAIEIGCAGKKQIRGVWRNADNSAVCAVTAASLGGFPILRMADHDYLTIRDWNDSGMPFADIITNLRKEGK